MDFSKLEYPVSPVVPTRPTGLAGTINIKGSYRKWALEVPATGDPYLILKIQDFGDWAITLESILADVMTVIEDAK